MLKLHPEPVVPPLFQGNRPHLLAFFQFHIFLLILAQHDDPLHGTHILRQPRQRRGQPYHTGGTGHHLPYGDGAKHSLNTGEHIHQQRRKLRCGLVRRYFSGTDPDQPLTFFQISDPHMVYILQYGLLLPVTAQILLSLCGSKDIMIIAGPVSDISRVVVYFLYLLAVFSAFLIIQDHQRPDCQAQD